MAQAATASRPVAAARAELEIAVSLFAFTLAGSSLYFIELRWPAFAFTLGVGVWAIRRGIVSSGDSLNSLTVLWALALVRVALPGIVVLLSGPPDNEAVRFMNLTYEEWMRGAQIAAVGITGITFGWFLTTAGPVAAAGRLYERLTRKLPDRPEARSAGRLFLVLGLGTIIMAFVLRFGSVVYAVSSGIARSAATVQGTSRYIVVGITMLYLGPMLTLVRSRRQRFLAAMVPAFLAMLVLSPLGGRVIALTPIVLSGLVYWYRGGARVVRASRAVAILAVGFLLLSVYATFLAQYRAGGIAVGERALQEGQLNQFFNSALWSEVGVLYPYALAGRYGPSTLPGSVYPAMTGYFGSAVGIEGTSTGSVFAENLEAVGDAPWGFHTGFVIDVYSDSGILPMALASVLFGLLLAAEYKGFRSVEPSMAATITHALAAWTFVWLYFESIAVVASFLGPGLPMLAIGLGVAGMLAKTRRSSKPYAVRSISAQ